MIDKAMGTAVPYGSTGKTVGYAEGNEAWAAVSTNTSSNDRQSIIRDPEEPVITKTDNSSLPKTLIERLEAKKRHIRGLHINEEWNEAITNVIEEVHKYFNQMERYSKSRAQGDRE